MTEKKYIAGPGYRLYKRYVRFMNEKLMYRHIYYLGKENLPALGEPCMIVSCHQNCANDPLNMLLGLENESHPYIIARGNVFSWHPLITKFFLWLGMLPAFRLNYDGQESLGKNEETIRISGGKMIEGNRLVMYPEGTHQNKHWLGEFSFGYTRLAFQTAEKDNFQHDIQIVPSAHHYADYFELQTDVLIRFGTPVSLAPYYESYKTKPRTAQREVNKLIRGQIESMMLDIRDLEHYEEIEWLRNSEFANRFCLTMGKNPDYLPDKLDSDKILCEKIQSTDEFWDEIRNIHREEENLGIRDTDIAAATGWTLTILNMLVQVLLLPLWIVSLYPNIFHYNIHRPFMKTDRMFTNSWRFIIPVVVGVPFFFILTVLVCGLAWGWWWQSAVWMFLATYPLALFAFYYWKWLKHTRQSLKILCHKDRIDSLKARRENIFENIMNKIQ
ncbi:MAG: 1-acyl-sn-glycerol-3-phosphate acyltransferase [Paludibacteraceae bacterium]|nr:1-acyl-sn-glycerol-3-phosphate acyltransferase [Paludibacteraceae bacterium]